MGKKILVVDDSSVVRQQVKIVLEQAGFEVSEAEDGEDGVEKIGLTNYDGVVCDINMPKMNGLEFVEAVQSAVKNRGLPILMLTTENDPAKMRRAQEAGARGWMVKPFQAGKLVDLMLKLTGS